VGRFSLTDPDVRPIWRIWVSRLRAALRELASTVVDFSFSRQPSVRLVATTEEPVSAMSAHLELLRSKFSQESQSTQFYGGIGRMKE